jgi:SAM-dependent methyltransferase
MVMTAQQASPGGWPDIHPDDHLFRFLCEHPDIRERAHSEYFSSGRECALKLRRLIEEHRGAPSNLRLLEFASGYGRVTRHMAAVLPEAITTACDIHPQAVRFLTGLGLEAVGSSSVPERFHLGRQFDVVFALSFFSHLPRMTWTRWLRRLVDHVNIGGLMIFTTHGERSRNLAWPESPTSNKFLFSPVSEQIDLPGEEYGRSLTPFAFVYAKIAALGDMRLVRFQEAGWFGHQDIYVLRRASKDRSVWRRLMSATTDRLRS